MKPFFLIMAAYFAWRAFKYSHLVQRTNRQNKEWLDEMFPDQPDNERVADAHRRSMLIEYLVAAAFSLLTAYLVR